MSAIESGSGPQAGRQLRELADVPGPRGIPLLGVAPLVRLDRMHQQLEAWRREFGPLYRMPGRRGDLLVVADHELVTKILRDRPDGFSRTAPLARVSGEMGLKPGVFGANGETWKRQRRIVMAAFDPGHVKAYFPSLQKVTMRLCGRWRKAAQAGTTFDLQADLMRFTVDAITGLAFGVDINTLESDDEIIQQHLDKIFPALFKRSFAPLPLWRLFKTAADRELDRSVAEVNVAIDGFIAQARARMQAQPERRSEPTNLLEAMIAAADEGGSGVGNAEVAGNVMTMLLAGEDTTANTLGWMIYLLTRHPQALARARAEVLAQLGEPPVYSVEAIDRLDFVEACAHETMRLKPVGPFIGAQALRDTVIGDVRVAAGTIVLTLMRPDATDERFVPDAARFNPERWLEGGDPAVAARSPKRVSMPFGAGPRICPGRYLALLEIKMAIAMLLAHFDIDALETPDGREPAEHMSFTMAPAGLTIRLRERAAAVHA